MKQATARDDYELIDEEPSAMFRPALVIIAAPNLRPLHSVWEWQERGKCREAKNELFFVDDNERGEAKRRKVELAKRVCRACPVIAACEQHAMTLPEPYGTWGGMSEDDRRKILRPRKK